MNTPVFEKAFNEWQASIKATEARVRIENKQFKQEVLDLLKTFKRPTVAVKEMITRLENE
jgi:hypothetical protein